MKSINTKSQMVQWFLNMTIGTLGYIFDPIKKLTLGTIREGTNNRTALIRLSIASLPLLLGVVSIGVLYFRGLDIDASSLSNLEPGLILAIAFGLYSVINFLTVYIRSEDKLRNAIFTTSLFLLAAMGFLHTSPPGVYIILAVTIYGMGSYVSDRIEFENPYPSRYVSEELSTTEGVVKIASVLSVLVVITLIGMTSYTPYNSDSMYVILLTISAITSYNIPRFQMPHYENLYKHRPMSTPSHFWILPPKLIVMSSFGFALADGSISLLTATGLLMPLIFSVLFAIYIRIQKTNTVMGLAYRDSDSLADPLYVSSNKEVEIDSNVEEQEANIEMQISIEIAEELPDDTIAWQEFLKSTDNIYKLLSEMSLADNTDEVRDKKSEFDEFYDDVAYRYYVQKSEDNGRIPVEGWADEPITRVKTQMHRSNEVDLQDIYDMDIRKDDKKEQDPYINVNN